MSAPLKVGELAALLESVDQSAWVLLGQAPGPLAHATETVNGFVILDRCTGGTCCRPKLSEPDRLAAMDALDALRARLAGQEGPS